jgi:hypothetical protein
MTGKLQNTGLNAFVTILMKKETSGEERAN